MKRYREVSLDSDYNLLSQILDSETLPTDIEVGKALSEVSDDDLIG